MLDTNKFARIAGDQTVKVGAVLGFVGPAFIKQTTAGWTIQNTAGLNITSLREGQVYDTEDAAYQALYSAFQAPLGVQKVA